MNLIENKLTFVLKSGFKMKQNSRLMGRKVDRLCCAGLSLSNGLAQLVVITGGRNAPEQVYCAEHLAATATFVSQPDLAHPTELGVWLKKYLVERDLAPQHISFSVSDASVDSCVLKLPAELSQEDLAFQLTAELLHGRVQLADQFCVDYQPLAASPNKEEQREVTYRAAMTQSAQVRAFKQVAKAMGLPIYAIEPSADALLRLASFGDFVSQPNVAASGVLQCQEACGLALSAWSQDDAFNFYPYRLELQQREHRMWAFQLMACVSVGVLLAATLSAGLAYKTDHVMSSLKESFSVKQALDSTQKKHEQLQQIFKLHTQTQQWLVGHNAQRQQGNLWRSALSQMGSDIWISDLQVQHKDWIIQGEALSAEGVHQALAQLGALPVWSQKPMVERLRISSESSLPVWGFKAFGELKGG